MSDTTPTPSPALPRLLVSLATFNEAGNLEALVETIRQFAEDCSILVIDDNSPDGTGRIADELAGRLPRIEIIHRASKLGLGTAMLEAIAFAVRGQYDYLLNLDADFSHPPRFIPDLLRGMSDHDVMIGSRYVPGGGVEGGFNLKRKLMSSGINWYARFTLGLSSKDNSGGISLLSREQARRDRPVKGPLAGLLVSGRDPLLVQTSRLPDRRNAHPVREPPLGYLEDQTCARLPWRSGSSSSLARGGSSEVDRREVLAVWQLLAECHPISRSRTVT